MLWSKGARLTEKPKLYFLFFSLIQAENVLFSLCYTLRHLEYVLHYTLNNKATPARIHFEGLSLVFK